MKNLVAILALTTLIAGCTSYPVYSSYPAYTSQVTTSTYYTAPSYITGPGGFVESAPGATIYSGRTAPETTYQTYPPRYQQIYRAP